MNVKNEVLKKYNLNVGDKIQSRVNGYYPDEYTITKAVELKDGTIKVYIKPKEPDPAHKGDYAVEINKLINEHNRIVDVMSIQMYNSHVSKIKINN